MNVATPWPCPQPPGTELQPPQPTTPLTQRGIKWVSASAAALPPPPHTIAFWGNCRMQCGARSATAGGACARADRPTSAEVPRAIARQSTTPAHSCACPCHQNATADKSGCHRRQVRKVRHQSACGGRGKRQRGGCRLGTLCAGAPFATPRPPCPDAPNALVTANNAS